MAEMMKLKENYLAPLHEYTDLPFRMLVQTHKAKATMAPIISTTAITRSKTVLKHLDIHEDEKFLGAQLIGTKPDEFLAAAKLIADRFPCVKWLDVNSGCPSRNAFGSGGGAALLDKPKLIKDIVAALRRTDFRFQ